MPLPDSSSHSSPINGLNWTFLSDANLLPWDFHYIFHYTFFYTFLYTFLHTFAHYP